MTSKRTKTLLALCAFILLTVWIAGAHSMPSDGSYRFTVPTRTPDYSAPRATPTPTVTPDYSRPRATPTPNYAAPRAKPDHSAPRATP
jgi:hypothetical protein